MDFTNPVLIGFIVSVIMFCLGMILGMASAFHFVDKAVSMGMAEMNTKDAESLAALIEKYDLTGKESR